MADENDMKTSNLAGLSGTESPVKSPVDVPALDNGGMQDIPYRAHGVTVWFEKMPEKNPFFIVSEYGSARTIGRGNSFDEADIYREALEEIMDREGHGRAFEIAEAALDKVSVA